MIVAVEQHEVAGDGALIEVVELAGCVLQLGGCDHVIGGLASLHGRPEYCKVLLAEVAPELFLQGVARIQQMQSLG